MFTTFPISASCYIPYYCKFKNFNPLSANPTKWSNTFKQLVGNFPTNCLSVFDDFVGFALKGLIEIKLNPV